MNTPQSTTSNATLNKLRAAVLGANDGIVSISSVVMGVAGATDNTGTIFTAGLAALVAGALSMAVGEYVSVSSQSDAEKAFIDREKKALRDDPDGEFEELVAAYVHRGVAPKTARLVAKELTAKDAIKAHLETQFNLDEDDISSPMQAAVASFLAFSVGGMIPFLTIVFMPHDIRLPATIVAVLVALFVTGYASATVGEASRRRAITRVVLGGLAAMIITYYVGVLFGTSVA
ncbi:MAG: VIT family protein [Candidatus Saccharimonadales bacterium]